LIFVHLLDTLLTVDGNLATRRQAPGGVLRSIEAAARGTKGCRGVSRDQLVIGVQAVLIDARRQAGRQVAPVIPIGFLARYDRPAPALDAYDELLTRTIP
jgi:hypothetical protein